MYDAFAYFLDNFATLESVYPYTSGATKSSGNCLYSVSKATNVKVQRIEIVEAYGENSQLKAAVQKHPVTAAVAANNKYIH